MTDTKREPYQAEHPLDPADIEVDTRVSVPDWRRGRVVNWSNGTVKEVRDYGDDRSYIVAIDATGVDGLFTGYSVAAPLPPPPLPPLFILGPNPVQQIGSHTQCGRTGCTVKSPWWRVLLGSWNVQVLCCSGHLSWAVALDMVAEDHARAHGWQRFKTTLGPTQVVPELGQIKRLDFKRELRIATTFPQTVTDDEGNLAHAWQD